MMFPTISRPLTAFARALANHPVLLVPTTAAAFAALNLAYTACFFPDKSDLASHQMDLRAAEEISEILPKIKDNPIAATTLTYQLDSLNSPRTAWAISECKRTYNPLTATPAFVDCLQNKATAYKAPLKPDYSFSAVAALIGLHFGAAFAGIGYGSKIRNHFRIF